MRYYLLQAAFNIAIIGYTYSTDTSNVNAQGTYCVNSSTLIMIYTQTDTLSPDLFSGCGAITHANISHNRINYFSILVAVRFMMKVEVLDLSFNEIAVNGTYFFPVMSSLEHLYMTHNRLTTLPMDFFENKNRLKTVDLSNNYIKTVPLPALNKHLPQFTQFILRNNALTTFEPWHIAYEDTRNYRIRYLDLRNNSIERFSNTYNWTYYRRRSNYFMTQTYADVRHNKLENWTDSNFVQYKEKYRDATVAVIMTEINVDFRENGLNCDCNMYNVVNIMTSSFLLYNDEQYLQVKCEHPARLRGKRAFYDIRPSEYICEGIPGCPDRCTCSKHPGSKVIRVNCDGVELTEIPDTLPDLEDGYTYELYANDNNITYITNVTYAKFISKLFIANNAITDINIDFLNEITDDEYVQLDLTNNSLTSIPRKIENIQYRYVSLDGNRLSCTCDMFWMIDWINLAPRFIDKDLTCIFENEIHTVIDINESLLDCYNRATVILIIVLSLVIGIVIVICIVVRRCPYTTKVFIYKFLRIHPADKYKVDEVIDKEYDAYISYDEDDIYVRKWVEKVLVKRLETGRSRFRLFLRVRDMAIGSEAKNRAEAIERSRRTIVILSTSFIRNHWCHYDVHHAETLDLNKGRVIFILYDKKSEECVTREPWLSKTKARKVFRIREKLFWGKLRYELPIKSKKHKTVQQEYSNDLEMV